MGYDRTQHLQKVPIRWRTALFLQHASTARYELLVVQGHEHMRTIEEERDLLRRKNAELRAAAIGRGAVPAAVVDNSGAMDSAPTFPLDADVQTPRLPAAETVPMETCGGPARRSFESLCFVAAAAARNPLSGLGF